MLLPTLVTALSRLARRARSVGLPRTPRVPFGPLLAATVAAFSAGCSTPTESLPHEMTGRWILAAVDGQSLPVETDVGAELVGGDLQLSTDGSYWNQTRASIGGAMVHGWSEGRWTASGGKITLHPNGQSSTISANWTGMYIEIVDSRTLQYTRPTVPDATVRADTLSPGREPRR